MTKSSLFQSLKSTKSLKLQYTDNVESEMTVKELGCF